MSRDRWIQQISYKNIIKMTHTICDTMPKWNIGALHLSPAYKNLILEIYAKSSGYRYLISYSSSHLASLDLLFLHNTFTKAIILF